MTEAFQLRCSVAKAGKATKGFLGELACGTKIICSAGHYAEYLRDLARVKGGKADYYVIAELDIPGLRAFQSMARSPEHPVFKPKPDGYVLNPSRVILGDD